MTKTDELISKLEEYISFLQILSINEDFENENDRHKYKLFNMEISQLKEQIKKEVTLPSDKDIRKHLMEIYKPIFHGGIDLNKHFRNCAFKEIKWFKSQLKQSNK